MKHTLLGKRHATLFEARVTALDELQHARSYRRAGERAKALACLMAATTARRRAAE